MLALAPGLQPGTELPPMYVEELAPTMTAILGVDLAGVSGRPAPSLVNGNGA